MGRFVACFFLVSSLAALCGSQEALAQTSDTAKTSSARGSAQANSNPKELFIAGDTALRNGDLDRAERAFRKVVAIDPQSAGAYANLGVIYMRRKQWDQALHMLRHAERLAPDIAGIRLNIGLAYYRQNDFRSAIAPFESVLRDQPDSAQARYLLGLCYFFDDHWAQAADTLEPLWGQQSFNFSYLYVLCIAAHKAQRKELDERALSRLVEVGGDTPEFHLIMGRTHLNREEDDQALLELERAERQNPKLPFLHYYLGLYYLHQHDYEHSVEEFKKDIEIKQIGRAHV